MARRDASGAGCGLLALLLCGAPVLAVLAVVPLWVLCAPGFALYIRFTGTPAARAQEGAWWGIAAAAPVLALGLVWLASPRRGRLRGRLRRYPEDEYRSAPELRAVRSRRRRALANAYAVRVALLLGSVTATTLVVFARTDVPQLIEREAAGAEALQAMLWIYGIPGLVAVAVLSALYLVDRRPYLEPITADVVQAAAAHADRLRRQAVADSIRVQRLVDEVDAKIGDARTRIGFIELCDLHYESFGCADSQYAQFTSTQSTTRALSEMLTRAQTCARRASSGRGRARRREGGQDDLGAAAEILARALGPLTAEVDGGLTRVRTLNARTTDLKHSIRDTCGRRGQEWYDALQERVAFARGG